MTTRAPRSRRRAALAAVALLVAPLARADAPARPPDHAPSLPADAPTQPSRPAAAPPASDQDLPEALARALGRGEAVADAPRPEKRTHLAVLPFVLANPLMGAGGGLAVLGGARLGPAADTHFSRLEASGFATSQHQAGVAIRSELRLPADRWILVGDWGAGRFPNPAWGLGGSTREEDQTTVRRRQLQLHETAYRQVGARAYAGLGWFLDDFYDVVDTRAAAGRPSPYASYPWGTGTRSVSSGVTLSALWDDRDRPAAPSRGSYLLARYRFEPALLGSDDDWRSVYVDARTYLRVPGRRDVVALWAYAWSSFGQTPYLLLPSIGADPEHRSGRGWTEGRFTGQDLLYGEVEYRAHLWRWLGAVAAVNLTCPSERGVRGDGPLFRTVHPALVAGIRALLDRASGTNLTFDAAWAPGGQVAFYVNANEAF